MKAQIRAHFDGRVLVPDEPVDWPIDQPLMVSMVVRDGAAGTDAVNGAHGPNGHGASGAGSAAHAAEIADRVQRLRASSGVMSGPVLSDEALLRESLYEDRS